jgi:hypothetical protein
MTTSRVKFLCYNILEDGTVTVTAVDSGYPKERLFDRSAGFYCKYSATGAYVVTVNQGSTVLAVDTLIIEDHALNGIQVDWQYSSNGSSWTTALSWTQSGTAQILKTLTTPLSYQYWRVSMGSHIFQATEVFMGRMLSVPVVWSNQPTFSDSSDVERARTYGGVDHFIRIGPKRKQRNYTVFMDRVNYPVTTFISDMEYLDDYSKPFYIIDHEESCFLADFGNQPPSSDHLNEGMLEFDISVSEVKG